jgi:16S rRNA (guanine1207-N2)-methyltransferase
LSAPSRLALAIAAGHVDLPETGRIAVFGPRAGDDLSVLPKDRLRLITGFRPDHDAFAGQGYTCQIKPEGRFSMSILRLPRARALAEARVAEACDVTDGPVVVDGAKTDGVESILKACRARVQVSHAFSKAHGKLFSFQAGPEFEDWQAGSPREIEGGWRTLPGLFSADSVDPASRLLADHLPDHLGATLADLGAGWGYLSARALERESIRAIHLVEAEHAALDCARLNLGDPRAHMHWDDATRWQPPAALDCVITNPPFHTDRTPDPGLGRAFIANAARMLAPRGQLFLVANRHLPYEDMLRQHFAQIAEIGGDGRFKLLHAQRPKR